jgi:hypothetical protein
MKLKVAKVANFWGYGIGDLGRFATTPGLGQLQLG